MYTEKLLPRKFGETRGTSLWEYLSNKHRVQGGLIKWEYQSTDTGIISFEIGSENYEKWENEIFNLTEVNLFEHIEPYLL